MVEHYGEREEWWRAFFTQADALAGTPQAIGGFLLAVRDCCLAKSADVKVPDFVPVELAKRGGADHHMTRGA